MNWQETFDKFKANPLNWAMAGAGALVFGVLFGGNEGPLGGFAPVVMAVVGAVTFGFAATQIIHTELPANTPAGDAPKKDAPAPGQAQSASVTLTEPAVEVPRFAGVPTPKAQAQARVS